MRPINRHHYLLLEVINPHYHREDALENMLELEDLVNTLGGQVVKKTIQHRTNPHPATYIGPGKLEQLKADIKSLDIDIVVLNAIINSGQLFRLEKSLWEANPKIAVWDRVDLILNIFDRHASTREAKLQIELARLSHTGPRIYGLGRTQLSRQGGGIGTRGIGETNIEREKRLLRDRQIKIKKELKKLSTQKRQRLQFRTEQGLGPVALIGYTSAGKTTLFNLLTGKTKKTHQSLFTTLDTVVGKMKSPNQNVPVIISDTIGFIDNLPPKLIDAFRSTLMESLEAKLLLHIIDAADPKSEDKIAVVEAILNDLKVTQPVLKVYNKIDLLPDNKALKNIDSNPHPPILLSAKTGEGIEAMKQVILGYLI